MHSAAQTVQETSQNEKQFCCSGVDVRVFVKEIEVEKALSTQGFW